MKITILVLFILFFPILASAQTVEDYLNSGVAKKEKGDYKGAIEDFNKAIEHNPNSALAYSIRAGTKLTLTADYKGAIEDYSKAIELDPNDSLSYIGRGSSKIQLGQKESGCKDIRKAVELGDLLAKGYVKKLCGNQI